MCHMVKNADITLYHKEYSPEARTNVWQHTQYIGASWHGKRAVSTSKGGLTATSAYSVRIFTDTALKVAPDDIIVSVLCDEDDPKDACKRCSESCTVTGVSDNRRGSAHLRHWRLEGE